MRRCGGCVILFLSEEKVLKGKTMPVRSFADNQLLDRVQRETLRYFWEFAHPQSGLALDRSIAGQFGPDALAVGGSGFGLMALLVGIERGWLKRQDVLERLETVLLFLEKADRFHGAFPHFLHGVTGQTIPMTSKDNGGDIVETAFLIAGLLAVRRYFSKAAPREAALRDKITALWHGVEWNWYTHQTTDTLYWHWSPDQDWVMNFPVIGWDECLIAYILAAGSPTFPIQKSVYDQCWVGSPTFRNGKRFYDIELLLGPDYGGQMCFAHYSFLGVDPRGLTDRYADYFQQNKAHALIQRAHAIANPHGWKGYGADCWGMTASDDDRGYNQHAPDNDFGVISPTAALSSMPYVPEEAMAVLHGLRRHPPERIWSDRGFVDAFCESRNWYAPTTLAIDQGPIVVMIENHRSGLLWSLLMSCPEVLTGLKNLGFRSPHIAG